MSEAGIPPRDAWISLSEAGTLFDPPRNRTAVGQLVRRGVLHGWTAAGRVWTSESAVRAYASTSRGRPRLRVVRDAAAEAPGDAQQIVVGDLSRQAPALRAMVEQARRRAGDEGHSRAVRGAVVSAGAVQPSEITKRAAEQFLALLFEHTAEPPDDAEVMRLLEAFIHAMEHAVR